MSARGAAFLVSRQVGHADPNITAQFNAHLIADEQLDAAAAPFAEPTKESRARERALERTEWQSSSRSASGISAT